MTETLPLITCDPAAVESLLDAAFGTNRKSRTAYKLRDGVTAIEGLSFGIKDGDALIGSIQCWPVQVTGDNGDVFPLVLTGPVAVAPNRQNQGIGHMLMNASLSAANAKTPPMVMIGDPEYYGRFGFTANDTSGWSLPGPIEQRRLLLRNPGACILPDMGLLGPTPQY